MLQPQFGRKPGEEGPHGALCIWIQELHSGILGATPQAGKRVESGVPTGIRTPVLTVKGWCPRPLDDGDNRRKTIKPVAKSGGARRDRTADLLHAMQALSQLSYGPTWRRGTLPERGHFVKKM